MANLEASDILDNVFRDMGILESYDTITIEEAMRR